MFSVNSNDQIRIVIYNENKNDTISLDTTDNEIFYSIDAEQLLEQITNLTDTIKFNFLIIAGDGRVLPNNGLEKIGKRKLFISNSNLSPVENITDEVTNELLYSFDKPYEVKLFTEVTFRVGMSSQIVLGFFEPGEDRVAVYVETSNNGLQPIVTTATLEEEGNNIYSATVSIFYKPNEPLKYKFRIVTKRETIIPNDGYENIPAKELKIKDKNTEAPYCDFNNLRRVARFIIKTKEYEHKKIFEPNKGDVLQIKLLLDGKETLTDPLFYVAQNTYETAVVIPMSARKIKWSIVKNIKEEITEPQEIEIGVEGKIINN